MVNLNRGVSKDENQPEELIVSSLAYAEERLRAKKARRHRWRGETQSSLVSTEDPSLMSTKNSSRVSTEWDSETSLPGEPEDWGVIFPDEIMQKLRNAQKMIEPAPGVASSSAGESRNDKGGKQEVGSYASDTGDDIYERMDIESGDEESGPDYDDEAESSDEEKDRIRIPPYRISSRRV